MCPQRREHRKQEIKYEKPVLLLYQMINTPYSMDLNTPINLLNEYAVLDKKVGYDVSNGSGYVVSEDKMAEENVPTPTRTGDQLVPVKAHLPIAKSNLLMDLQKMQKNPIFCILVDILQNTNFFRAFTTSADVPSIYNADLLRNALGIIPKDSAHPFVPPPDGDLVIDFVNNLGYPEELHFVLRCEEVGKKKKASKAGKSKQHAPAKQHKPIKKKTTKPTPSKKIRKGKRFDHLVDEEDEEGQPASKPQVENDEYNLQRGIQISLESLQAQGQRQTQVTHDASTRPSTQPKDDTSANVVHDTSSPVDSTNDAETVTDMEQSNSETDTEILNVEVRQGKEVSNAVALEETTVELDEGQARSNPGKTPESQALPEIELIKENQAGSNPRQSHVAQAGPNPEPMHEDIIATIYPEVHENLKLATKEQVHIENPPSSSGTLSSIKNLEDAFTFGDQFLNDKSTKEESQKANVETKVESMVTIPIHQASSSVPPLDLSEFQMKEILHDRLFESNSCISHSYHTTLYKALEVSMQRENNDELHAALAKSRKRRRDDQDPTLPPPKDSDRSKKKKNDSDASASKQPLVQKSSAWKTSNSREDPFSSSKQKPASPSEQPVNNDPIPEDMHLSELEDTGAAHRPKIKTKPEWLKPLLEEETPETPKPGWVIPSNYLPKTENNWADAMAKTYKDLAENTLLQKTRDMANFIQCKPLPLGGPPGQITIQAQYFFNKDLEYLVSSNKERRHALSMSKLKAAYYPDFRLEELVPSL
ncbi:hypothetical protein Tco_1053693 [Tanacetum coccineum]|uniref:Uncharacterized protein n=1 Tax=Tanacetum coccineum TaxID=301880 RepID=A0ABQ5GUL9_9ASTR